jgi:hypothetical protein
MPRYILKIKDYYLAWSTIVDAPTFASKDVNVVLQRLFWDATHISESEVQAILEALETTGTSTNTSLEEVLWANRAGEGETHLSADDIYRKYCLEEPVLEGDRHAIRVLLQTTFTRTPDEILSELLRLVEERHPYGEDRILGFFAALHDKLSRGEPLPAAWARGEKA